MSPVAAPRRPPVFGPEPWATVAGQEWCHWDLWFCMVAVLDHGGDLGPLEARFVAGLKDPLWGRDAVEAKLSHLADLRTRLEEAGLSPAGLVPPDASTDKALIAKARRKVADRGLEGRAMTPSMADTPRARLTRRVRTGRWSAFPVDPAGFYLSFRRHVEVKDHISKGRSFGVVRGLEERLRRLDRDDLGAGERLALYRAFQTAGLELADRADDSYGVVGELREDAWHTYLGLDWRTTGMAPEDYWADLCGLVVFEVYGLGFHAESLPWAWVPARQAELIEDILKSLHEECRSYHLGYQADRALQELAWLAIARRRFSRYVEAADALGTNHWREVEALAESALGSKRPELAVEVFRAADRPGWHRDRLRERCLALTGVDLPTEPQVRPVAGRLRVVPGSGASVPLEGR